MFAIFIGYAFHLVCPSECSRHTPFMTWREYVLINGIPKSITSSDCCSYPFDCYGHLLLPMSALEKADRNFERRQSVFGAGGEKNYRFPRPLTLEGTYESATTVRYLVIRFNASQKPLVAFGNVPRSATF